MFFMRIFLVGVSCVGKTSIGSILAKLLNCRFFDFDEEVEKFFGTPIECLQNRFENMELFRQEASKALQNILVHKEAKNAVIALPPSGLRNPYWEAVSKEDATIIHLEDDAMNILKRIDFFDKDSNLIIKKLSEKEKIYYLSEIKKDIIYYKKSYKKATFTISIRGLDVGGAAAKIKNKLSTHR